uniref:Uncharacterized protein n=1 Tax=Sphaerodactylus townsendi TaxID=933632 RepID=A0ACB8FKV0_9SAUR
MPEWSQGARPPSSHLEGGQRLLIDPRDSGRPVCVNVTDLGKPLFVTGLVQSESLGKNQKPAGPEHPHSLVRQDWMCLPCWACETKVLFSCTVGWALCLPQGFCPQKYNGPFAQVSSLFPSCKLDSTQRAFPRLLRIYPRMSAVAIQMSPS